MYTYVYTVVHTGILCKVHMKKTGVYAKSDVYTLVYLFFTFSYASRKV